MKVRLRSTLGLTPPQASLVFGAVRAVVEADGQAGLRGAALLEVVASALELEDVGAPRATAAQLLDAFPSPAARRVLVDVLLVPACVDALVSAAAEDVVRGYARDLGVRSHWVELLTAMRLRRVLTVKRALVRRSPDARRIFARTWAEEGLVGMLRILWFVLGMHRDPRLAARFHALSTLPAGTLGEMFHEHCTARGLAFPGERGGMPERMLHHDLMHVVNGYGTDPAGECELAGFYAGFADGDAFTFIVIALATFQIGLPVSPSVVLPARGAFDAARVLAAFVRGRALKVDVMGRWDYWELMPLPLEDARSRLGLGECA